MKRHVVAVQIETDDNLSISEANKKVQRWLETFGHTAPSFGFEFTGVVRVSAKMITEELNEK